MTDWPHARDLFDFRIVVFDRTRHRCRKMDTPKNASSVVIYTDNPEDPLDFFVVPVVT
jgi:hypothetical protein